MSLRENVIASYPVRLRLAIAGLTIAWVLAALFLVLGLRANADSSSMTAAPQAATYR